MTSTYTLPARVLAKKRRVESRRKKGRDAWPIFIDYIENHYSGYEHNLIAIIKHLAKDYHIDLVSANRFGVEGCKCVRLTASDVIDGEYTEYSHTIHFG